MWIQRPLLRLGDGDVTSPGLPHDEALSYVLWQESRVTEAKVFDFGLLHEKILQNAASLARKATASALPGPDEYIGKTGPLPDVAPQNGERRSSSNEVVDRMKAKVTLLIVPGAAALDGTHTGKSGTTPTLAPTGLPATGSHFIGEDDARCAACFLILSALF